MQKPCRAFKKHGMPKPPLQPPGTAMEEELDDDYIERAVFR